MRSSFFSRKCILGLLAGAALAIPAMQAAAQSTYVTKGSKAASEKSCVAETSDIRRNHMDYMKHGRDEVVIDGDRTGQYSLAGCIDCHAAKDASGKYLPVDSEDQFCHSCHAYVAVNPACFQCHRTTPEKRD
ncbi:MAG: sulfur reduction protein DsrJ [Gammaproteobacteria bacterium]|nr:sulfur reduction protein DsrJ [Gammaproteobacteria bacterium]